MPRNYIKTKSSNKTYTTSNYQYSRISQSEVSSRLEYNNRQMDEN